VSRGGRMVRSEPMTTLCHRNAQNINRPLYNLVRTPSRGGSGRGHRFDQRHRRHLARPLLPLPQRLTVSARQPPPAFKLPVRLSFPSKMPIPVWHVPDWFGSFLSHPGVARATPGCQSLTPRWVQFLSGAASCARPSTASRQCTCHAGMPNFSPLFSDDISQNLLSPTP
jgi:hypothetical protein